MERLHPLIAIAFRAAFFFALANSVAGQTQCSLRVRALSPDGRRPVASVRVQEENGRIEDKEQDGHDVEFCDLGGLPVTVMVGDDDSCNQVVIRNVPVAWRQAYLLHVTYDPLPCIRETPRSPVPLCRAIFRVSSGDDWVPAAVIMILQPVSQTLKTDEFGRASLLVKEGAEVSGSLNSRGGTANFKFYCEHDVQEQDIKAHSP